MPRQLTFKTAQEIRRTATENPRLSQSAIARRFDTTQANVSLILSGKTHKKPPAGFGPASVAWRPKNGVKFCEICNLRPIADGFRFHCEICHSGAYDLPGHHAGGHGRAFI